MKKNGVFQPLKCYKSTAKALCFTVLLPFFIRLRLNHTAPLLLKRPYGVRNTILLNGRLIRAEAFNPFMLYHETQQIKVKAFPLPSPLTKKQWSGLCSLIQR